MRKVPDLLTIIWTFSDSVCLVIFGNLSTETTARLMA